MPAGTQICRGFNVHKLIMCESKVQVDVSQFWPIARNALDSPIGKRIWVFEVKQSGL